MRCRVGAVQHRERLRELSPLPSASRDEMLLHGTRGWEAVMGLAGPGTSNCSKETCYGHGGTQRPPRGAGTAPLFGSLHPKRASLSPTCVSSSEQRGGPCPVCDNTRYFPLKRFPLNTNNRSEQNAAHPYGCPGSAWRWPGWNRLTGTLPPSVTPLRAGTSLAPGADQLDAGSSSK